MEDNVDNELADCAIRYSTSECCSCCSCCCRSDHVVILSDELQAIAQELVRGDFLNRVHIGLDFFDASINRVLPNRNAFAASLFSRTDLFE